MSGVGCGVLEGGRKKSRLFRSLLVDGGASAGDGITGGAFVGASVETGDREKR